MALYDGWKYIMSRDEVHELYDLRTDPMAMRNLIGDSGGQEREARMAQMIRDMVAKSGPDHYGWVLQ